MSAQELNNLPNLLAKASYYWRFEGNSNSTVGSNNGTDSNISYSTTNAKFGQAATFNGTNSGIALASAINTVVAGNANFTMSAWIYLSGAPNSYQGAILSVGDYNSANNHWVFGIHYETGGGIYDKLECDQNGNGIAYTGNFALNTPYHVLWTHTSAGVSNGYVNGIYIGTHTDNAWANTDSPSIGKADYTTAFYFNGTIDDLAIFNSVLTQNEIKLLATGVSGGAFLLNFV